MLFIQSYAVRQGIVVVFFWGGHESHFSAKFIFCFSPLSNEVKLSVFGIFLLRKKIIFRCRGVFFYISLKNIINSPFGL